VTAGSADFHALLQTIGELHDRKQLDYGKDDDPFANVRSAEQWGVKSSLGACIRIGDKVARLQTFHRTGVLANESVEDAYQDLAVYALIALCLHREEVAAAAEAAKAPAAQCDEQLIDEEGTLWRCVNRTGHLGAHVTFTGRAWDEGAE
jgi:hypothetical protein